MGRTSPDLNVMIRAAEKAGRSLVRDFGEVENLQVSTKGPGDFVSAADHRAEEIIFEELQKARPEIAFLMEENGTHGDPNAESRWIIDPLDGTSNFLHGIPQWAISIALETKGEVVAGIVYDPIKDEMFQAEKGQGAFVKRQRLRVSGRHDVLNAVAITGAPRRKETDAELYFKEQRAVWDAGIALRRFGAASLDLCYVAAGRCEAFWERTLSPWDVAAGSLIVKEAGGFVCDIDDDKNSPIETGNILAANETLFTELKKVLKAV